MGGSSVLCNGIKLVVLTCGLNLETGYQINNLALLNKRVLEGFMYLNIRG